MTDGDIHIQTAMYTDPVTELKVRTTSETATDLPILRHSKHTDIGLINGIVAINIGGNFVNDHCGGHYCCPINQ